MKSININEYNPALGILIDCSHPLDYAKRHDPRSVNIYADKLIMNHWNYLNKNDTYYIMCQNGKLSKKVIMNLRYFGYKLIQVVY